MMKKKKMMRILCRMKYVFFVSVIFLQLNFLSR
jgi:hypothetical protein